MSSASQRLAEELRSLVPASEPMLDIHTHAGIDEDGMSLTPERLVGMLDSANVETAAVFPLHDPDRVPAYQVPNDRVLHWAEQSDGRLIPFCRLDPTQNPIAEAERCLDHGARGIKLHPRAQGFSFASSSLPDIFRCAQERGVPILIHAGRGMAPIAHELCDLALRIPATVILAHAGIADQAIFATRLAEHPAAYFDTSVFNPLDISELFARVPAERILFGSDPPYGRPLTGGFATARVARSVGCTDAQIALIMGGSARGILNGDVPHATGPLVRSRRLEIDGALSRIYSLAMTGVNAIIGGGESPAEWVIEMAEATCREPSPDRAGPTLERIAERLSSARSHLAAGTTNSAIGALWVAAVLAVSENVDLP